MRVSRTSQHLRGFPKADCGSVFAKIFAEGVYQRIDLELGKTHAEYEKNINDLNSKSNIFV